MAKEFSFMIKDYKVKVVNRWFDGIKLYINGECRDQTKTVFIIGNETLLSANLDVMGVLEIVPQLGMFSIELDAYLLDSNDQRLHIYSSNGRVPLKAHRLINN
jgi:hypothetical protein